MVQIGYTLSSEEFGPRDLVDLAIRAEELGFDFASISDHYHPWLDAQGHSPFVWSTLGGIASRTSTLPVITGVTALSLRYHPALLAQAVATVADMMPGRFSFGIGTGEALNEHIVGGNWPPVSIRQDMMEESLEMMRELWKGGYTTIQGSYYDVHNARLYTLPEEPPPVLVAASGVDSATLAAEIGDGLISTAPDKEVVDAFRKTAGDDKPIYGQVTVSYDKDETAAKETALRFWGQTVLGGQASQELPLPKHYQEAIEPFVTADMIAESVVCGANTEKYHEKIQEYIDAGFSHIYIHQVGLDQKGFFGFAEREILPTYHRR